MHKPVLLHEAIEALKITPSGKYIDGTFGRGGHSKAMLEKLSSDGKLIAFDRDSAAKEQAEQVDDPRFSFYKSPFSKMRSVVEEVHWLEKVNGILLDLGVSSPQFDDSERGFSFTNDGPLDMRMDSEQELNAEDWLAAVDEKTLADVLYQYGEERYSRRIAKAICMARSEAKIQRTKQLADIIAKAHPAWKKNKHPATRSFQAIRIFINSELEELKTLLNDSYAMLAPKGRIVIISFHSLEDKIVKEFIQSQKKDSDLPKEIPLTADLLQPKMIRIGKSIRATKTEIDENPRSRSAIMRVAEKI